MSSTDLPSLIANAPMKLQPDDTMKPQVDLPADYEWRTRTTLVLDRPVHLNCEAGEAHIVLTSNGAELGKKGRTLSTIRQTGPGVALSGIVAHGSNPSGAHDELTEAQHGIEVAGAPGLRSTRCRTVDTGGDAVYLGLGAGGAAFPARDVVINDFVGSNCGRQGITPLGRDITITNWHIDGVARSVLDFEPHSANMVAERIYIGAGLITGRVVNYPVASKGAGIVRDVTIDGLALPWSADLAAKRRPQPMWRMLVDEPDAPGQVRDRWLIRGIRADRGSDGGAQPAHGAYAILVGCSRFTFDDCEVGEPIQQNRTDYMVHAKAGCEQIWVINSRCQGSGVVHPSSVGTSHAGCYVRGVPVPARVAADDLGVPALPR